MPTTRKFAYNTGSIITGATQYGSLAIGVTLSSFSDNPGGVKWWNGPDEDLGYVIAHTVPSGNQPNPKGLSCSVGFWRTTSLTDQSFLTLVRQTVGQSFATASNAATWLNTNGYWTSWSQSYTAGLFKTTYSGYFNDDVSFFTTATPATVGTNPDTSVQTTSIFEGSGDSGSNFSCQWLGYFKPTTTETYTFYTASDDASYVWIGDNVITGFTTTNAIVKNGGLHGITEESGTVSLTAGVYYPIRIQFGELNGGDAMTFNFSTPTITKTTVVTGLVFYNSTTNNF
jgi:hypothetical protein